MEINYFPRTLVNMYIDISAVSDYQFAIRVKLKPIRMRFTILLILLLFTGLSEIAAQQQTDTLQIINVPGKGYTWDGNYLNSKRMKAVLLSNDEASGVYRSALANRSTAVSFLITGGAILAGGLIYDRSVGLYKVA